MSSVKVNEFGLREVDICDGELESDEESAGFHDVRSHHLLQEHSECANGALTSLSPKRCLVSDEAVKAVRLEPLCYEVWKRSEEDNGRFVCRSSIVDCLLVELYDTYSSGKGLRSADSLDSSTEASGSDAFLGRSNTASSFLQELQEKHTKRHQRNYLSQKGLFLCFVYHKWKWRRRAYSFQEFFFKVLFGTLSIHVANWHLTFFVCDFISQCL